MSEQKNGQQPFLVTHDKCPVCGNVERLGQQAVDRLKSDKILPAAFDYAGIQLQSPLLDPRHPPTILASTFTIKVLVVAFDVCASEDCGAIYCTRFDVVEHPAQVAPPQEPSQQMFNRQMRRHPN